jgi:hypothetical protein
MMLPLEVFDVVTQIKLYQTKAMTYIQEDRNSSKWSGLWQMAYVWAIHKSVTNQGHVTW